MRHQFLLVGPPVGHGKASADVIVHVMRPCAADGQLPIQEAHTSIGQMIAVVSSGISVLQRDGKNFLMMAVNRLHVFPQVGGHATSLHEGKDPARVQNQQGAVSNSVAPISGIETFGCWAPWSRMNITFVAR
jgi:hypothetical protein